MSIDIYHSTIEEIIQTNNISILIVEDSASLNKILFNKFSNQNFKCLSAFSIKEANKILENEPVDYLLLDIHLPDGNGYELINKLEKTSTKIFVLSSEQDSQFKETVFQKGIIDYTYKGKDFFRKLDEITKTIIQLEKNKFTNILVVEDSKVVQHQLKEILENRKYNVIITSTIQEAKEKLKSKDIHFIMLDIELTDGSGIDFLWQNKEDIIIKNNIPVMIVSGVVTQQVMRDALKAGAFDVITKPYIIEEILLKVDMRIEYQRKDRENRSTQVLLKQYKNTVDRSSLVSKTNNKGLITYLNDQFCEISGYDRKELIGKNHNIIRHPDMDKETFKDLWHTIKVQKEPWEGRVKNRKKNGEHYWVDTLINPIIDENGEIEEFIAIRKDITEEKYIEEHFKNELAKTDFNFQHALQLSKQYEHSINESNILSRANLNGTITYVNDKFCEITGYSREEVIGKNHNLVRDEDTSDKVFKELWKTIKSGKSWKGILKNKKKNGKPYWVDTTIVPIVNNRNKITEYMAIRHDLSELFELHKEIEDTQKEVIYKMGEIGETRSKETGNHVKRVAEYSKVLALLYGLDQQQADTLFTASPMHDIGKVGISDDILKKPGKLTPEEYTIMKSHAEIGYNILKGSKREVLKAASIVSYEHHEKWDGTGYPLGLKGEEIHIYGRITAVADVFDALGSPRYYKEVWEDEKIFEFFKEESGKQFEPKLVELFFEHFEKFDEIRQRYNDI